MRHSISLYQSDKEEFHDRPTGIFWMNAAFVVALVVTFFLGSFYFPVALGAAGVHTALWLTNQQWGMDEKEIEFWTKYKSLPKDYRKTLSLTPKYVRELDGRAWSQAKQKVDNIYNMRQQSLDEIDMPDDLRMKFAAIEAFEKERAAFRRESEAEFKTRYPELH